jgi:hypothetical protein
LGLTTILATRLEGARAISRFDISGIHKALWCEMKSRNRENMNFIRNIVASVFVVEQSGFQSLEEAIAGRGSMQSGHLKQRPRHRIIGWAVPSTRFAHVHVNGWILLLNKEKAHVTHRNFMSQERIEKSSLSVCRWRKVLEKSDGAHVTNTKHVTKPQLLCCGTPGGTVSHAQLIIIVRLIDPLHRSPPAISVNL